MGQKKLKRFAEIEHFTNVLQYPENMAGNWASFFEKEQPVTLELACGKGEYTLGLSRMYPNRNFLGIDLKGNRLWVGARTATREGLTNAGFMRTQIDRIATYFNAGEVAEIWITFPDPQLRFSKAKKRLTHPKFLRLYQQILQSGGYIHLKTDSPVLYSFTLKVIDLYNLPLHEAYEDIAQLEKPAAELAIKTHYEQLDIAQSKRVHYIRFSLPDNPLPDLDETLKNLLKDEETD